jgi:hypothetical protein
MAIGGDTGQVLHCDAELWGEVAEIALDLVNGVAGRAVREAAAHYAGTLEFNDDSVVGSVGPASGDSHLRLRVEANADPATEFTQSRHGSDSEVLLALGAGGSAFEEGV